MASNQGKPIMDPDEPVSYDIKVQGWLDDKWADWFGGMTITIECEYDSSPVTTLVTVIADQSALRGILNKVWDLNLKLLSVNRTEADPGHEGAIPNEQQRV